MKPMDYFFYVPSETCDPALTRDILTATDPREEMKEDKLLQGIQAFWTEIYKEQPIKDFVEQDSKKFNGQLRLVVQRLHQLMRECLHYFPHPASVTEFRLTAQGIHFFREIDNATLGGHHTFIGRFYSNYYSFGSGPEVAKLKKQRLESVKKGLEIIVGIAWKEWQEAKPETPGQIAQSKIAIATKLRNIWVTLAESLTHCSGGLLAIPDQSRELENFVRGAASRREDRYNKKRKIIDGSAIVIDWKQLGVEEKLWGSHGLDDVARYFYERNLGVKPIVDKDAYSHNPDMQAITGAVRDPKKGVLPYFNQRFHMDYLADVATIEIVNAIQAIFTLYQGKPLASKTIAGDDADIPTYAQNFIKAMQPYVDKGIFTEEELLKLDEEGLPVSMIELSYIDLYIRCMPAGLSSCIEEKEILDIRELVFGEAGSTEAKKLARTLSIPTTGDSQTLLMKVAANGWLFRLKILLDAGVDPHTHTTHGTVLMQIIQNKEMGLRQKKIAVTLALTACRNKPALAEAKQVINWQQVSDMKSGLHNLLAVAANIECDDEIFQWILAQAEQDCGGDAKQLSTIVNRHNFGRVSAWKLAVYSMNALKVKTFLSKIPGLESSTSIGDAILAAENKITDHGIALEHPGMIERYPLLKVFFNFWRAAVSGDIFEIEKLFSAQKNIAEREFLLKILFNQCRDGGSAFVCSFLGSSQLLNFDLDTLLALKKYAPSIDLSSKRTNFLAKSFIRDIKDTSVNNIELTPLTTAIAQGQHEHIQRLLDYKIDPTIIMMHQSTIFATSMILAGRSSNLPFKLFKRILAEIKTQTHTDTALTAFINHHSPQLGSCLSNLVNAGKLKPIMHLLSAVTQVDLSVLDFKKELKIPGDEADSEFITKLLNLLHSLQTTRLPRESCLAFFEALKPPTTLKSQVRFKKLTQLFTIIRKQLPKEKYANFFQAVAGSQDLCALVALEIPTKQNLFMAAVAAGDDFLVNELISKNTHVNIADEKTGLTPVMMALQLPPTAFTRAQTILKQLLKHHYNVIDAYDKNHNSALHYAAQASTDLFDMVVDYSLNETKATEDSKISALFQAKNKQGASVVDNVLKNALENQNYKKVLKLLPLVNMLAAIATHYPSELDAKEESPQDEQILLTLIAAIAKGQPDHQVWSYFRIYAQHQGGVEAALADQAFKAILSKQFNQEKASKLYKLFSNPMPTLEVLMAAIKAENTYLFNELLETGIDLNDRDRLTQSTILIEAVKLALNSSPFFIEPLLKKHAQVTGVADAEGQSALHYAMASPTIFSLLLNHCIDECGEDRERLRAFLAEQPNPAESIVASVVAAAAKTLKLDELLPLLPLVSVMNLNLKFVNKLEAGKERALLSLLAALQAKDWVMVQVCFSNYLSYQNPTRTEGEAAYKAEAAQLLADPYFSTVIKAQLGTEQAKEFFGVVKCFPSPGPLLFKAIRDKNIKVLTYLANNGADLNEAEDKTDMTPVMALAQLTDLSPSDLEAIAKSIIPRCEILAAADHTGKTALHYALAAPSVTIFFAIFKRCSEQCRQQGLDFQTYLSTSVAGKPSILALLMSEAIENRKFNKLKLLMHEIPLITQLAKTSAKIFDEEFKNKDHALINLMIKIQQSPAVWSDDIAEAVKRFVHLCHPSITDTQILRTKWREMLGQPKFIQLLQRQLGPKADKFIGTAKNKCGMIKGGTATEAVFKRSAIARVNLMTLWLNYLIFDNIQFGEPQPARIMSEYLQDEKYEISDITSAMAPGLFAGLTGPAPAQGSGDVLQEIKDQAALLLTLMTTGQMQHGMDFILTKTSAGLCPTTTTAIQTLLKYLAAFKSGNIGDERQLRFLEDKFLQSGSQFRSHRHNYRTSFEEAVGPLPTFQFEKQQLIRLSEGLRIMIGLLRAYFQQKQLSSADKLPSADIKAQANQLLTLAKKLDPVLAWCNEHPGERILPQTLADIQKTFSALTQISLGFFTQDQVQFFADKYLSSGSRFRDAQDSKATTSLEKVLWNVPVFTSAMDAAVISLSQGLQILIGQLKYYFQIAPQARHSTESYFYHFYLTQPVMSTAYSELTRQCLYHLVKDLTNNPKPLKAETTLRELKLFHTGGLTWGGNNDKSGYIAKMNEKNICRLFQFHENNSLLAIVRTFTLNYKDEKGKVSFPWFSADFHKECYKAADETLMPLIRDTALYDSQSIKRLRDQITVFKSKETLFQGKFKEMLEALEAELNKVTSEYKETPITRYGLI